MLNFGIRVGNFSMLNSFNYDRVQGLRKKSRFLENNCCPIYFVTKIRFFTNVDGTADVV